MSQPGQLFIVATPIGNLSDLSARVIETLRDVSAVAAEDTRRTRELLAYLGLSKPLLRCDEAREDAAARGILAALAKGDNVALVSDAGVPGISDPGAHLVDLAHRAGFRVTPIPGPSAVTTALSVCGFRAASVGFYGFLSRKGGERTRQLEAIALGPSTSVFFESPPRVLKTVTQLSALAPERMVFIGRELTKRHEEISRMTLAEAAADLARKKPRGEFTLVVAPLKKSDAKKRARMLRKEEE